MDDQPQVINLTADDLAELHKQAITIGKPGSDGLRSYHSLASAAQQPYQTVFGEDAYPTIPEKAAAHAYFLAENQPFVDGNKRTAALALTVFLDINGYDLREDHDMELAEMLVAVGGRTLGQGEFFGWVVNHAKFRQPGLIA